MSAMKRFNGVVFWHTPFTSVKPAHARKASVCLLTCLLSCNTTPVWYTHSSIFIQFVGFRVHPFIFSFVWRPLPLTRRAIDKSRKLSIWGINSCDQPTLSVYSAMKLGTIWKEALRHFHGTCGVYPMHSVNINLAAHPFSRDIGDVWSQDMQRERIQTMLAEL